MHDLDAARALLADQVAALPAQVCDLDQASGLRLAQDVASDLDLPPFAAAAMDGYAARSDELAAGGARAVAFEVAAGATPGALPAGQLARIFTGAVLPPGADVVVMQEDARVLDDGRVELPSAPAGDHVRQAGELCRREQVVAGAGSLLTPARVAVLAAVGAVRVSAIPRPRVAIVVTGDELVDVGSRPGPGQIRDSNRLLLQALVHEAGCTLVSSQRASDTLEAHRQALGDALEQADVVLSSGGVSAGDRDLVPQVLHALGATTLLHKVRVKPGKPVLVARRGQAWALGLPGNPVSVAVSFRLFARPLLEALAGDAEALAEQPLHLPLAADAINPGQRTLLIPARWQRVDGVLGVAPLPWKGSHDLVAAADCQALLRLAPGQTQRRGEHGLVYALPWRLDA